VVDTLTVSQPATGGPESQISVQLLAEGKNLVLQRMVAQLIHQQVMMTMILLTLSQQMLMVTSPISIHELESLLQSQQLLLADFLHQSLQLL
jgi:hypothetical protein